MSPPLMGMWGRCAMISMSLEPAPRPVSRERTLSARDYCVVCVCVCVCVWGVCVVDVVWCGVVWCGVVCVPCHMRWWWWWVVVWSIDGPDLFFWLATREARERERGGERGRHGSDGMHARAAGSRPTSRASARARARERKREEKERERERERHKATTFMHGRGNQAREERHNCRPASPP
jgi:hypothetical protein